MRFVRTISIVGCHAEGEVGDVIIGGVLDVPGKTMYDKLVHFRTQDDGLRQLLLNEPRGRSSMNTNLVMAPFATPAPTPASSSWRARSARPCPGPARSDLHGDRAAGDGHSADAGARDPAQRSTPPPAWSASSPSAVRCRQVPRRRATYKSGKCHYIAWRICWKRKVPGVQKQTHSFG